MNLYLLSLGLLCLGTLSYGENNVFSNACNDFTVDLLKTLSKSDGENVLYSPLSINLLLSAIYQGARGDSFTQLQTMLGMDPETSRNSFASHLKSMAEGNSESLTFKMGNKMYLKPDYLVEEAFKTLSVNYYNMGIENLDLATADAPQIINNWVANSTDNHITDLIQPGSLSADSVMVLVSAVFFSGKWAKPFSDVKPTGKFFTAPNVPMQVPFFIESRRLTAGRQKDLGFKWVELPYEGYNYSMILILPIEMHNLEKVIQNLSGDLLMKLLNSPSTQHVSLRIPKFTLKKKINAAETLKKMGLVDIFSNKADLSGIGSSLKVSEMQHEAFLEVTHEGTKAAAATSMVVNTLSLNWNPDEMKFNANHPFLAFIIDKKRQIPLFAARISQPQ